MKPITRGERRLLSWLERFDFTGKGCYPTRAELAERCDYTEEYISALVKGLRTKGYITVTKRRRPGCQYAHNVYRVHDWSPNVRRGICNLRADFVARRATKEARERAETSADSSADFSGSPPAPVSGSYLERTAKANKGSDLQANPLLSASNALPARSRARESRYLDCERRWRTIRRRGGCSMQQQRRHLHVADLTCPHCKDKDHEIDQLREINRTLAIENTELTERHSSAIERDRVQGKEISILRRRITRQANEDAEADVIREICDDWKQSHPKASTAEGGRRWEVAKKALRLMRDDEAGARQACIEALEGLRLRPYQEYERRYATPAAGRVKRDDIEHALGDEVRIERCRAYARWARMVPSEKLWAYYEVTSQVSEFYFRRAVDAAFGVPDVEVAGAVGNVASSAKEAVRHG